MTLALCDAELADLLRGPHVGIIAVAAGQPSAAPLVTPMWYAVEPTGRIVTVTARTSRKVRLLGAAGRATFLVHENVPLRHASADVDVEIAPGDERVRRLIAARYLPPDALEAYLSATADADTVVVRLHPRRWRAADLTKPAAG